VDGVAPQTFILNGITMNIGTIVVDLANSRLQLYALKTDPAIAPTKLDYCTSIMDKLQNTIGELLTLPWIPRTVLGLNGSIAAVLANIRKTESAIDDRIEAIGRRKLQTKC
jgi:hypothetical protein